MNLKRNVIIVLIKALDNSFQAYHNALKRRFFGVIRGLLVGRGMVNVYIYTNIKNTKLLIILSFRAFLQTPRSIL